MNLTSGHPFWLIKDGMPYTYKKLSQNIKATVLIIGGGISGALAAFYLTQAKMDCTLIDARTIGLGSTSASTSLLHLLQYELVDTPLHQLIKKVGKYKAVRSYQLCNEAIDKLLQIMKSINYK